MFRGVQNKMARQLRLDFSDYSAEEQERDANKKPLLKVIRHAYLMKIDGEWAHFIIGKGGKDDIDFYEDQTLEEVYRKLTKSRPEYKLKVIMNEGLENYLRDRREEYKKNKAKQLLINFSKGNNYEH